MGWDETAFGYCVIALAGRGLDSARWIPAVPLWRVRVRLDIYRSACKNG